MRISDWSSDVCSSDLHVRTVPLGYRPDCRSELQLPAAVAVVAHVAAAGRGEEGTEEQGVVSGAARQQGETGGHPPGRVVAACYDRRGGDVSRVQAQGPGVDRGSAAGVDPERGAHGG